jgi:hypothetical protein
VFFYLHLSVCSDESSPLCSLDFEELFLKCAYIPSHYAQLSDIFPSVPVCPIPAPTQCNVSITK